MWQIWGTTVEDNVIIAQQCIIVFKSIGYKDSSLRTRVDITTPTRDVTAGTEGYWESRKSRRFPVLLCQRFFHQQGGLHFKTRRETLLSCGFVARRWEHYILKGRRLVTDLADSSRWLPSSRGRRVSFSRYANREKTWSRKYQNLADGRTNSTVLQQIRPFMAQVHFAD